MNGGLQDLAAFWMGLFVLVGTLGIGLAVGEVAGRIVAWLERRRLRMEREARKRREDEEEKTWACEDCVCWWKGTGTKRPAACPFFLEKNGARKCALQAWECEECVCWWKGTGTKRPAACPFFLEKDGARKCAMQED